MTKEEVYQAIVELSRHQGFYSGLLDDINSQPERGDVFLQFLEDKNFKDTIDLIMYLEG